jgi:hypothetical protein
LQLRHDLTDPRYLSRNLPGVSVFYKNEAARCFMPIQLMPADLNMPAALVTTWTSPRDERAHPNAGRRDEYDRAASSHH